MIYIDLDGVLANFNEQYLKYLKSTTHWSTIPGEISDFMYADKEKEFWDNLDAWGEVFWTTMSPFVWTLPLVERLSKIDDYRYLSSPVASSPASYSGKAKWIEKTFPRTIKKLLLVPSASKCLLAKSKQDVLIDDRESNIKAWTERGGTGYQFSALIALDSPGVLHDMCLFVEATLV